MTRQSKKNTNTIRYNEHVLRGEICCGDALKYLKTLRDSSASIVFLDPPFNLGKLYNKKNPNLDRLPSLEYQKWLREILNECIRITMPGGTLYLYHLPIWAMRFGSFLETSLKFRHWIAISMKNGFVRGRRLYPAHYALLMFTKGEMQQFVRPKIKPATCRHCHDFVKDYGGYRSIIESKGINLSDVWDDLSPVRHANRKHRSANELPEVLFKRIIEMSGSSGSLYVDPFAGTGSGVLAAADAGMYFAACDIVDANFKIIQKRLEQLRSKSKGAMHEHKKIR